MLVATILRPKRLAVCAATLALLTTSIFAPACASASVEAQFRGCEAAGWCRFRVDPSPPGEETLLRVRPDGLPRFTGTDAAAAAMRDRLNALLASMIHQHKQVRLEALRALDDGTFAAGITVNGADVATDPQLLELQAHSEAPNR